MSLPFKSTPGDTHTTTIGGRMYDVYKLIRLTEHLPAVPVPVETVRDLVTGELCWTDTEEMFFSPRELLTAFEQLGTWELVESRYPNWSDHIKRVKEAECQFPLLMYRSEIVDGMHRATRAVIEKTTIRVRKLIVLPAEARYYGS